MFFLALICSFYLRRQGPCSQSHILSGGHQVVHNPGTPPDSALASPAIVDIIVTCEEPFERYTSEEVQQRLKDYFFDRSRSGYQISGVPRADIKVATGQLRQKGAFVFATSLVEDFYESFGACWEDFVEAMEVN